MQQQYFYNVRYYKLAVAQMYIELPEIFYT
jgi:hypothetical protein